MLSMNIHHQPINPMARFNKKNGQYVIHGKRYPEITGSRAKVWHGTAYETPGGLPKSKLMMNKKGHIVSRKKYLTAKKEMRLVKHGYGTRKGHFGHVKITPTTGRSSKRRGSRRRKSTRKRRA